MKRLEQADMFADSGSVGDLPLFSGTAPRVVESVFDPQPVDRQAGMFERDWSETARLLKAKELSRKGKRR